MYAYIQHHRAYFLSLSQDVWRQIRQTAPVWKYGILTLLFSTLLYFRSVTRKNSETVKVPQSKTGYDMHVLSSPELWEIGINIQNPDSTPACLLSCLHVQITTKPYSRKKPNTTPKKKLKPETHLTNNLNLNRMFPFFVLKQKQKQEKTKPNYYPPRVNQSHSSPFLLFYPKHLNYPTSPRFLNPNPTQTQTNLTTTTTLPIHPITNHQHRGEGGVELNPHFSYVS